ncbi:unnamed protein product [Cyprideis torosa]|uniref:Proteasomal ubiquitin receptor ADRM1 homolog n=1 Tax=Cyprideis torosa TaxID=163714 RepID=A0A7R8WA05_9CRUS|nr:unnamed protein product [Cyprideis torosa]CAG0889057.1 unnamed protein product [Cyprideis torosa]
MATASGPLFGPPGRSGNKNLLEFKAGKMYMEGKMVHPDKRKGLVYLYQSDESLMHFCWKDRSSGTVEDDYIIFPEDCEFKLVSQCTTGKVFLLRFKHAGKKKIFYWLQEPQSNKADDICSKVNDMLNNPPSPGSNRTRHYTENFVSSRGGPNGGPGIALPPELSHLAENPEMANLIGSMNQQQLMQLFTGGLGNLLAAAQGGPGGGRNLATPRLEHHPGLSSVSSTPSSQSRPASTPANAPPVVVTTPGAPTHQANEGAAATRERIGLADLRSILQNINVEGAEGSAGPKVDLSDALTVEALQPILTKPEFVQELVTYLPKGEQEFPPVEALKGTVQSPQFKQAVGMFCTAFQSGDLTPLIKQFGFGDDAVAAASQGNLEAFLKALSKNSGGSTTSGAAAAKGPGPNKDKDGGGGAGAKEEPMQTD